MIKNPIPFFSLKRQHKKYKNEIEKKIIKVLNSQQFIGGQFVQEFEKDFAKYLNVQHVISCNSGTDALWLALKALDLKENEIVITTPFSFIASSSEIVDHKAHPVFIDIKENTYNIDSEKIETWINQNCIYKNELIHKKTGYKVVGILPVDIYGQCANYHSIKNIATKYGLWILQDSCQSVGAIDKDNIYTGNHGNISCFSFYPTKNLGAYGDAGCCTTNDPTLAEKLIYLRNHGRKSHYNYAEYGKNSRLDGIQAAVLTTKLKYIDKFNNKRREIAATYNKELSNIKNIKLSQELNGKHIYHQYCVELKNINREKIIADLKEKGIGTSIYYPKSLNKIDFLNKEPSLKTNCSISEKITKNIIALPIWPELEKEEIQYICTTLKKIIEKNSLLMERNISEQKGIFNHS